MAKNCDFGDDLVKSGLEAKFFLSKKQYCRLFTIIWVAALVAASAATALL